MAARLLPLSQVTDARRIPSLDGLRAIAVSLVVLSHLAGTRAFPVSARLIDELDAGALGVRVFFVISGFLISLILFDELGGAGRIRLARFYFRRTLRIFPPYYALLLLLAGLAAAGRIFLAPGDLLHAVLYTSNYNPGRSWRVSHTWSLAVEEQFYLVWPALLIWLGRRRGLAVAAAFVIAAPLLRVSLWMLDTAMEPAIRVHSETIADAIAVGCLLAGFRALLHRLAWYRALLASPAVFFAVPVVLVAHELGSYPLLDVGFGYTVVNVGCAIIVDRVVTYPGGWVGRILNCPPLVLAGVLSYSIYLWQQIFLARGCGQAICAFPVNILATIALAVGSYLLIERPSLALRRRLEGRLFGERRDIALAASPETEKTTLAGPPFRPLSAP